MQLIRFGRIAIAILALLVVSGCAAPDRPRTYYLVQVAGYDANDETDARKFTFDVLSANGIRASGNGNAGNCTVCVPPSQATRARELLLQEQKTLSQPDRDVFHVDWVWDENWPPPLDFLTDLPALRNVSAGLSEQTFLKLLRENALKFRGTVTSDLHGPGGATRIISSYEVKLKAGVAIYFRFRDGRCCLVNRMQS